jgi:hypothetical protein
VTRGRAEAGVPAACSSHRLREWGARGLGVRYDSLRTAFVPQARRKMRPRQTMSPRRRAPQRETRGIPFPESGRIVRNLRTFSSYARRPRSYAFAGLS